MNTVVGWLGLVMVSVSAIVVFLAPLDDLLINFHWTVPLAMALVGLILLALDLTLNRDS